MNELFLIGRFRTKNIWGSPIGMCEIKLLGEHARFGFGFLRKFSGLRRGAFPRRGKTKHNAALCLVNSALIGVILVLFGLSGPGLDLSWLRLI